MNHNIITENMSAWQEFGFWFGMTKNYKDSDKFIKKVVEKLSEDQKKGVITLLKYGVDNLSTKELEQLWISGNNCHQIFGGDLRTFFEHLVISIKRS